MAGLYGVMAFVAGQRSKEIAVRMALGAGARSVLWLMLSRGLKITAIGLTAGVLGAIASTRLVSGMLFQVRPHDVVTYASVVGALGLLSSPMRFQLANVGVTSLRSLSQAQESDPTTPVPPASARRLLDLSDGFTTEIKPTLTLTTAKASNFT